MKNKIKTKEGTIDERGNLHPTNNKPTATDITRFQKMMKDIMTDKEPGFVFIGKTKADFVKPKDRKKANAQGVLYQGSTSNYRIVKELIQCSNISMLTVVQIMSELSGQGGVGVQVVHASDLDGKKKK